MAGWRDDVPNAAALTPPDPNAPPAAPPDPYAVGAGAGTSTGTTRGTNTLTGGQKIPGGFGDPTDPNSTSGKVLSNVPGYNQLVGLTTPTMTDLGPVHAAQQADFTIGGNLAAERAGATPTLTGDQIAARRAQQQQQLDALQAAANGTTPSVAAMQAEHARQANVANQFGLAAAMRGHSPGGALAQASDATARINSDASASGAALRADEMQKAQLALAQQTAGARNQDTAQTQQDLEWRKALLSGQLEASGQGTSAAVGGIAGAKANADADNKAKSGIWQGLGGALGF